MSTPKPSLVKWVDSALMAKTKGKFCNVPVIPLDDLTELANGLRTIVGHAHDGAVLPKQQLHGEVFVTYDGVGLTLTVEHDPHRAPSQRIYLDRDAIGQLHALLMAVAAS